MITFNFKENKIDNRHNYLLCMDTETANTISEIINGKNKLNMDNVLFYDLGGKVIDTKGRVYETFSFVNADIYLRERDLMQSSYYAHKLPQYEQGLRDGSRTMRTTLGIKSDIKALCDPYGIKTAVDAGAYNGDTAREMQTYFSKIEHIYAIEPDKRNFKKLSKYSSYSDALIWDVFVSAPYVIAS